MIPVNTGHTSGQWTVYKDWNLWQFTTVVEFVQKIDEMLSSPQTERGNHHTPPNNRCLSNNPEQGFANVIRRGVYPVAVSGLRDQHIAAFDQFRVAQ